VKSIHRKWLISKDEDLTLSIGSFHILNKHQYLLTTVSKNRAGGCALFVPSVIVLGRVSLRQMEMDCCGGKWLIVLVGKIQQLIFAL
jgi:hypothetical protein